MRKTDEITDLPQDLIDARKAMWRQELQEIEQRGNDFQAEQQKKQKLFTRELKLQSQKNVDRWAEEK